MNEKVNMHYRFLWDEEPTEEQLATLMQEVGEAVRREQEEITKKGKDMMQYEIMQLRTDKNK